MTKNLTNIKTEYFLIVNGVKQLFCYKTKEEAINYARPHLNNETKIEVLTVKTEIIVEKNAGNHKITTRDKMITAFLIGALLFLAAFMINIYIIRRF